MQTKPTSRKPAQLSRGLLFLLASAAGLIVANLYYAQPLVGPIGEAIGATPGAAGLVVTMTQLGYAAGLLLLVPLSDLLENRRLILAVLSLATAGLLLAALSRSMAVFFPAAVLIGLGSVAAQILVPMAAHLAPEEQRGAVVGSVMSGLLLGIMLARPAASLITGLWGWHVVYWASTVLMVLLALTLYRLLPQRKPASTQGYGAILRSLGHLFLREPVLRRRALYQAAMFGSFSLFWTVVPLVLAQRFHLDQSAIALFAFVGVAGAVAAPIAGRLADRGWSRNLTWIAIGTAILAFAMTHMAGGSPVASLVLFGVAAVLLDMAVSGNLVVGQQAIYALGGQMRGRVNGIFMAVFFAGGALGSALGGWAYSMGGWTWASLLGLALPALAGLYALIEGKPRQA